MTSARRVLLLSLPLAAIMLLSVAQARWLLASVYAREVREAHRQGVPAKSLVQPLEVAVQLSPWNPALHLSLARALYGAGAAVPAVEVEYRLAIAAAPADAYVWIDRAQMLAAQRRFGPEFEAATARMQVLAPSAPNIQRSGAQMGLKYWFRGSPELQKIWLANMAYELRREPRPFLRSVVASGSRYSLCSSAALELPLERWCSGVWEQTDPEPPAGAPR